MLPNLQRGRRYAGLVCLPGGHLIIIGGYDGENDRSIDSVECLSLTAPHRGWQNIAPLPESSYVVSGVYFHGVVLIAGGQNEGGGLTSTYVLKPPKLPLPTGGDANLQCNTNNLGQWVRLSAELPFPAWAYCICRVGDELFTFGEFILLSRHLKPLPFINA